MSEPTNDAGPAFPLAMPPVYNAESKPCYSPQQGSAGMTLRDYFAGLALQGILAYNAMMNTTEKDAALSYQLADAMIEARSKKPTT